MQRTLQFPDRTAISSEIKKEPLPLFDRPIPMIGFDSVPRTTEGLRLLYNRLRYQKGVRGLLPDLNSQGVIDAKQEMLLHERIGHLRGLRMDPSRKKDFVSWIEEMRRTAFLDILTFIGKGDAANAREGMQLYYEKNPEGRSCIWTSDPIAKKLERDWRDAYLGSTH